MLGIQGGAGGLYGYLTNLGKCLTNPEISHVSGQEGSKWGGKMDANWSKAGTKRVIFKVKCKIGQSLKKVSERLNVCLLVVGIQ